MKKIVGWAAGLRLSRWSSRFWSTTASSTSGSPTTSGFPLNLTALPLHPATLRRPPDGVRFSKRVARASPRSCRMRVDNSKRPTACRPTSRSVSQIVEEEVAELKERAAADGDAEAGRISEQTEDRRGAFPAPCRRGDHHAARPRPEPSSLRTRRTLTAQLARDLLDREMTEEDRRRVFDRSLDAMTSLEGRGVEMGRFRAFPYAKALLTVVQKDAPRRAEEIADELDGVAAALQLVPDFQRVLVTPMVSVEVKTKILDAVLDALEIGEPTRRFLHVVQHHYRMQHMTDIATEYPGARRSKSRSHPCPGRDRDRARRRLASPAGRRDFSIRGRRGGRRLRSQPGAPRRLQAAGWFAGL